MLSRGYNSLKNIFFVLKNALLKKKPKHLAFDKAT